MGYMCHMIRDETSGSWIAKRIYREWIGIFCSVFTHPPHDRAPAVADMNMLD